MVLVIAAIWGRVAVEANAELEAAQAWEALGDTDQAISRYQYAMRWYSPFATAPHASADALWRIGQRAIQDADRRTALSALRQLRGADRQAVRA